MENSSVVLWDVVGRELQVQLPDVYAVEFIVSVRLKEDKWRLFQVLNHST